MVMNNTLYYIEDSINEACLCTWPLWHYLYNKGQKMPISIKNMAYSLKKVR